VWALTMLAARALLQKLKCPRLRKRGSGGGCRGGRSCASCAGAPSLTDYLPLYLRHVGGRSGLCVLVRRLLLPPRFRRRMGRHRRALASWSSPFSSAWLVFDHEQGSNGGLVAPQARVHAGVRGAAPDLTWPSF
jgi:hypothetical protein